MNQIESCFVSASWRLRPSLRVALLASAAAAILADGNLGALAASPFTNLTTKNGLGSNTVNGVYALGSSIYAATSAGLSISSNNGTNWGTKTTTNGLGSNTVNGVFVSG